MFCNCHVEYKWLFNKNSDLLSMTLKLTERVTTKTRQNKSFITISRRAGIFILAECDGCRNELAKWPTFIILLSFLGINYSIANNQLLTQLSHV